MQFCRAESPYRDKGLQKVYGHKRKCFGTHIFFKDTFGHIAQNDEDIDKEYGEKCAYHGYDYSLFPV